MVDYNTHVKLIECTNIHFIRLVMKRKGMRGGGSQVNIYLKMIGFQTHPTLSLCYLKKRQIYINFT